MPDHGDGHATAHGQTQSDPEFHRQSLLTQGYWEDASGALHPPSGVVDGNWWPPEVVPEPTRISGMAIASLVLGLVPVVPFVGSILAIVFGAVARSQIAAAAGRLRGAAMAAWGIFLGILSMIGTVIVIVVLVNSASSASSASSARDYNASSQNGSVSGGNNSYNAGYQFGQTLAHHYGNSGSAAPICAGSWSAAFIRGCEAALHAAGWQ